MFVCILHVFVYILHMFVYILHVFVYRGLTPADCELEYLRRAQRMSMYGVERHAGMVRDGKKSEKVFSLVFFVFPG